MDKDTKKIIEESKLLKELTEHEGYQLAKNKLINRISALIDVSNVDINQNPEQLAVDIRARQKASQIILEWLRVDVEGTISQTETNTQGFTLNKNSWIINEDEIN